MPIGRLAVRRPVDVPASGTAGSRDRRRGSATVGIAVGRIAVGRTSVGRTSGGQIGFGCGSRVPGAVRGAAEPIVARHRREPAQQRARRVFAARVRGAGRCPQLRRPQQIILSDPEAIRHILIENPDNYRRTAATHRLLAPVLGRGMLLATGEDWRAQRRAAAPALAPRMMPDVARTVAQACDRLIDELTAPRANGGRGGERGRADRPVRPASTAGAGYCRKALFSLDLGAEGPVLRAELQEYAEGAGRPTLLDFLLPRCLPSRARSPAGGSAGAG